MPAQPLSVNALDQQPINWQRVDPRYPSYQLVGILVSLLINAVIFAGLWYAVTTMVPNMIPALQNNQAYEWASFYALAGYALLVIIGLITRLVLIYKRYKAMGYAERDEELLFRRGVMFHRVWAVPYGRIQSAEVSSGPLERAFGLANLQLRTAGVNSNIALAGLPREKAEQLREELVARGQAKLAGL
ncbi:PH domain-containing protein [Micrococcoides hystricis]|uniref:PH domain-containing protein n=1 Tax=Micrococcoides hystricis TaxID=1572761 RepID=A0ABV6PB60_9MICC